MMRIDVFTIFPEMIEAYCRESIVGRARTGGLVDIRVGDLRQGAEDPRRSVDDSPFGGGAGMVLAAPPVFAAVERADPPRPLYLLSPGGERFDQAAAARLAALPAFSLLCGRYEGVDQRITDHLVDGEISIGDFVLAGGEIGALAIVEAVVRLLPGALGNDQSALDDSFTTGLLEYPQYTRPAEFRGWTVPDVLTSGDHAKVARWRLAEALHRTTERRPDLIEARGGLTEVEEMLLSQHGYPVTPVTRGAPPAAPPLPAERIASPDDGEPPEERCTP